jgi:hypothetical protein
VACDKTESGILNSFDFKDRKGVLYSLFAVGAAGSEVANRNDFRDRFHETPFRPKNFFIKFYPVGLDKVPSSTSRYKFT